MASLAETKPPRLTPNQWDLLDRVVQSNGGGVNCYSEDRRTFRSLEAKGLIQGKSGDQCCAVHTREGLEAWRLLCAQADAQS